jgi:Uma2 family endonuclease
MEKLLREFMDLLERDDSDISSEEDLDTEMVSDSKHENYDGRIIKMNGASLVHSDIVANLMRETGYFLKGKSSRVLSSDMRVSINSMESYMYPDVVIVGDKPELEEDEPDTLTNPSVLIEVLSPATEDLDRGVKFYYYRQIPSVKEFILIDPDRYSIELWRRQTENSWNLTTVTDPAGVLEISTINFYMPLKEIYRNIEFEEEGDEK